MEYLNSVRAMDCKNNMCVWHSNNCLNVEWYIVLRRVIWCRPFCHYHLWHLWLPIYEQWLIVRTEKWAISTLLQTIFAHDNIVHLKVDTILMTLKSYLVDLTIQHDATITNNTSAAPTYGMSIPLIPINIEKNRNDIQVMQMSRLMLVLFVLEAFSDLSWSLLEIILSNLNDSFRHVTEYQHTHHFVINQCQTHQYLALWVPCVKCHCIGLRHLTPNHRHPW